MDKKKKIIRDILPKKIKDERRRIAAEKEKAKNDFFDRFRNNLKEKRQNETDEEKNSSGLDKELSPINAKFRLKTIILFFIFIIGAVFYLILPASSAVVEVVPTSRTVNVSVFLKAAESGGDLNFFLEEFSAEKQEGIKASGTERVEKKSSGTIVVFNNFSSASQILISGTRFSAPDGKIYKIEKRVVVPGAKLSAGKIVAYGQTEALVYAERAGEEYNKEFSDFAIPGLKGTAKYEKFFARSKTSLAGGFKGDIPKVSSADLEQARSRFVSEFKAEFLEKTREQSAEDKIFLEEQSDLKLNLKTEISDSAAASLIKAEAKFLAPMLSKKEISDFLAKKYSVSGTFPGGIYLRNFDSLNLKIMKADLAAREITIKIEGGAVFAAFVDSDKLRRELSVGKDKKDIFVSYAGIEKATITLKPFFKRKLPKDPSKIKIEIR